MDELAFFGFTTGKDGQVLTDIEGTATTPLSSGKDSANLFVPCGLRFEQ
jgi:hypothetical protein